MASILSQFCRWDNESASRKKVQVMVLTAEEIFQEEVYEIAMKYSAGAVQTESLLMSTEAVL